MKLDIVTPEKNVFSGKISLISVPGAEGCFEVLPNHAPILSLLEEGKIKVITEDGQKLFFQIESGVIEVKSNKIIVLAEKLKEVTGQ
jgi:F-type H+-transporting ATPase subunit epsilon